jgi:hypothetical protein
MNVIPTISIVTLIDRSPVIAPEGLVYSTSPLSCLDTEGNSYVVKGPEPNIVVAEALGYMLALELGIGVPEFAFAKFQDSSALWFASKKMETGLRDVSPILRSGGARYAIFLSELAVFDAWVANLDRNIGNLLIAPGLGLIAIDFEKSQALRGPHPLLEATMIDPRKLRPSGVLTASIPKPLQGDGMLRRVDGLTDARIRVIVQTVEAAMGGGFTWATSTTSSLIHRRKQLREILKAAWA